jgi:hypothetical protein
MRKLDDELPVPWDAPAIIGVRRSREGDYTPELVGLSLKEALDHVTNPSQPRRIKFCIWVRWGDREIQIEGRPIMELALASDRPRLPTADHRSR